MDGCRWCSDRALSEGHTWSGSGGDAPTRCSSGFCLRSAARTRRGDSQAGRARAALGRGDAASEAAGRRVVPSMVPERERRSHGRDDVNAVELAQAPSDAGRGLAHTRRADPAVLPVRDRCGPHGWNEWELKGLVRKLEGAALCLRLGYRTQRLDSPARLQHRARKLAARLDGASDTPWLDRKTSCRASWRGETFLSRRRASQLVEPVEDDTQLSPRRRIGLDHDEGSIAAHRPVALLRKVEGPAEQHLRGCESARG